MDTELAQDTEGESTPGGGGNKLFQRDERAVMKCICQLWRKGQGSVTWTLSQPPIFALAGP